MPYTFDALKEIVTDAHGHRLLTSWEAQFIANMKQGLDTLGSNF